MDSSSKGNKAHGGARYDGVLITGVRVLVCVKEIGVCEGDNRCPCAGCTDTSTVVGPTSALQPADTPECEQCGGGG